MLMSALFNRQRVIRLCAPTRPNFRVLGLKYATIALLLVNSCSGFAQETQHEQHFFLVDVSGSMDANPPRSRFSHLEIRKQELKEWFAAHSTSSVTLMTFFAKIDPEEGVKYDLGTSLNEANKWADRLTIQARGGTHLWNCLRAVLTRVSGIVVNNPDSLVTVHVLTDGIDTERKNSLDQVIGDFPYARTVPMSLASQELGDFDVKVTKAITPKPTISASPSPGPSSPPPPPEREKISQASSGVPENVSFEIQEPRIVSSLQIVHFINKTSPAADSYAWTIRHNLPRDETKTNPDGWIKRAWKKLLVFFGKNSSTPAQGVAPAQNAAEPEEIESSDEHLVRRFENGGLEARSYTVRLFAKYGSRTIAAPPLSVLVQAPPKQPSGWDTIFKWLSGFLASGSLIPLGTELLKLLGAKKADRSNEEIRKSRNRLWIWLAVTAVLFSTFIFLALRPSAEEEAVAAETSAVEAAARVQATSRSSSPAVQSGSAPQQGPVSPTNNITVRTDRLPGEVENATASIKGLIPTISIFFVSLVAVFGLIMAALTRREKGGSLSNRFGRPVTEQLDEIERLASAKIIPKSQVSAFRKAILEQVRKQYEIIPKTRRPKPRSKITKASPQSKQQG